MILSPLEISGTSQKNGFPVVVGRIEAEKVMGKVYRSFNESLAMGLMPFKDKGMINLILVSENDKIQLPPMGEIRATLSSEAGRFLEEFLREFILVGFMSPNTKMAVDFSNQATGVKVSAVKTLEEAYERLDFIPN